MKRRRMRVAVIAAGMALASAGAVPARSAPDQDRANPFAATPPTKLPYDTEYPVMHYGKTPTHNAIAQLQQRLQSGAVKLIWSAPRGYLDSLLSALGIDPSSQALVYSKTSLEAGAISAATPRALYFDTDTYVGFVQGFDDLQLSAMDSELGQVFYSLPNRQTSAGQLERKTLDCLACHDTYEMSGGGVPRFLLMSTYVNVNGDALTHEDNILTTDETPIESRWGGWYVTGQTGRQVHVGNIQVHAVEELVKLDKVRRVNIETVGGLFDTAPYLTDHSDVVALLVLQHQVTVQNLLTRVNFEVREALAKSGNRPAAIPAKAQGELHGYMDDLAQAMLFVDAAPYTDTIRGNSGFDAWFQKQGPTDPKGRSLRELDLKTRLFRYPLSYLVYTPSFDALPDYARDYVFAKFVATLQGQDALQILAATKPAFAQYLARHPAASR